MFYLNSRLTSSLEKCFLDQLPEQFAPLSSLTMLRNQHASFQLVYRAESDAVLTPLSLETEGELTPFLQAWDVRNVPVLLPAYAGRADDNYLRLTPGLYPDLLEPLHYGNRVSALREQTHSIWLTLSPEGALPAGEYPLIIRLRAGDGSVVAEHTLSVRVADATLPPHGLLVTQWFHCDGLAQFYHVPVFSERHWEVIENFLRTAAAYGQTMILTPLFTPPLDTAVGGERLTVQLVDVARNGEEYTFGFDRLDRWIDLCERVGLHHFEMSHLFTQWGAAHAPKIMARVDGGAEEVRIFGWETDATGAEYAAFLRAFLPALLAHLKARGVDTRCKFHISDEPNDGCLEAYRSAKAVVGELLAGYDIMDALSSLDFYRQGIVSLPIPGSNRIKPFLDAKVEGLWTYYCCSQSVDVSNRFIAMPLWRTRAIGMQCYKYGIAGFLQWGFNFYNNMHSGNPINPYVELSGDYQVPAGDAFIVYPGADGDALPSIRLMAFREALEDIAAMKLCESRVGKDAVVRAMENVAGEIRFDRCPHTAKEMLDVREAVDRLLMQ